ncbi:MAG: hypothetical protein Q8936_16740 [Bacillota bacterium]|nr:hypothetical protein [Bacillota bacterium]
MSNITTSILTTAKEQLDQSINQANQVYTQLDNKSKDINDKVFGRKFKPKFTQTIYCMNYLDDNNQYRTVSYNTNTLDSTLIAYKNAGIEGISIPIHIGYRSDTNTLYYQTNLTTIDYVISKCNQLGIPVFFMKFHEGYTIDNVFAMGIDAFKTKFKAMVQEVCDRYKNNGIQYLGLFNEWQNFYKVNGVTYNSVVYDFVPFVLECFNIAKNDGFKVSVSCAGVSADGWSSWIIVDDTVKNACDIFMVNGYPPIGNKGQYTTMQDCLDGWNNYGLHNVIRQIRQQYGGKPVIMSETGIMDYWYNFFVPGDSSLRYGILSNGETGYRYLYGLFESLKQYDTDTLLAVNWWYDSTFTTYTDKMKPLISSYLKGGIN